MVIGEFGMVKQAQTYPEWLQPISYPTPISGLDIRPTLQIWFYASFRVGLPIEIVCDIHYGHM